MLLLTYNIPKKKNCLYKIIRNNTSRFWKYEIKKRDNFTCQLCGKKESLEVHHKKPFIQIFKEFLKTYNQFSPIEDRNKLIKLAQHYKPFKNKENGKTLCKKCHEIIEEYKKEILIPREFKKEMML